MKANIQTAHDFARKALGKSAAKQKRGYDRFTDERLQFKRGDPIMYWYKPLSTGKLTLAWQGPSRVVRRLNEVTYLVQMGPNMKLRTVHANDMKYYHGHHAIPVWFDVNEESDKGMIIPLPEVKDTEVDRKVASPSYETDPTEQASGSHLQQPLNIGGGENSEEGSKLDLPPEEISQPTLSAYKQKQLLKTKTLLKAHAKRTHQRIPNAQARQIFEGGGVADITEVQTLLYPSTFSTKVPPEEQLSKAAKFMEKAGGKQYLSRSDRSRRAPDRYVATPVCIMKQEPWLGCRPQKVWGAICASSEASFL